MAREPRAPAVGTSLVSTLQSSEDPALFRLTAGSGRLPPGTAGQLCHWARAAGGTCHVPSLLSWQSPTPHTQRTPPPQALPAPSPARGLHPNLGLGLSVCPWGSTWVQVLQEGREGGPWAPILLIWVERCHLDPDLVNLAQGDLGPSRGEANGSQKGTVVQTEFIKYKAATGAKILLFIKY